MKGNCGEASIQPNTQVFQERVTHFWTVHANVKQVKGIEGLFPLDVEGRIKKSLNHASSEQWSLAHKLSHRLPKPRPIHLRVHL